MALHSSVLAPGTCCDCVHGNYKYREVEEHSLWSQAALDSSLASAIQTLVLWAKLLSLSEYHFLASKTQIMSSSPFSFFLSSSFL